jgi:serine/threonine protein kinase
MGYCCRDLSLENAVLMLDSRTLKIIDLGACKRMTPDSHGGFLPLAPSTPFGKPSYMAPEVCPVACVQYFAGREYYGVKIDLWSCGCVLYTMVTGGLCVCVCKWTLPDSE